MKQAEYAFGSIDEAVAGIEDIRGFIQGHEHADALITIYTSQIGERGASRLLEALNRELPYIKRAGMTVFPQPDDLGGERQRVAAVRMNLVLSDTTRFHVLQIPCEPGDEREAAKTFSDFCSYVDHVKGVSLYPANPALCVTSFLREATQNLHDVPFFGAMAALESGAFDHLPIGESFGIGQTLLPSGFTAVLFAGEHLRVFADYVLGWSAVGGELEFSCGTPLDAGEGCISRIAGHPAIEIYEKYLGVTWNDNFVTNVCEFPLMLNRNGLDICTVPMTVGDSGEIYLSGPVRKGERIRFSYGTRESVIGASNVGADRMREFGAQAVFMSLCGNRTIFLGDDAHVEWDLYRKANPQLAFCHGHYEIFWRVSGEGPEGERGGILNSALVAFGMREDEDLERGEIEKAPEEAASDLAALENPYADGLVPLSYRLSRFFDVMTGELVHLQHNLEQEVENKTRENERLMLHVVVTLAAAIDAKDAYTNGHSGRVARYSREIARRAGYTKGHQQEIYMMGILHDVGKIGVPDSIINKPGRLTDEEFDVIKTHPATGARILAAIEEMPGLATGAHWHHERYDGRGYPDGLSGEDIPEEARIIAVADAYDAMTSNRSYRDAMPQAKVREQILEGRGTQFDPRFADIMLAMIDDDPAYTMRG